MAICRTCKKESTDLEPVHKNYATPRCKSCQRAANSRRPPRSGDTPAGVQQRYYHIKCEYGLSREDYDQMILQQGGKCLLCGLPPGRDGKRSLSVDHCHTTKKVRGLLCGMCNTAIGKLNDDPALLRKAADYLEIHESGM